MKIGFIGLGVMGRPMAKNLLKAGYELHVYDIVPLGMEELSSVGAITECSGKAVAENSDIVITMLPNSPNVREAILGADGVLAGKHEGLKLIDMSSIAPLAAKEIGSLCEEEGVPFLESPVSGGEAGAVNGTLALMCGGNKQLFEELLPVLNIMARSITYCGELGAGNITKLVNQHIIAVEIAAVAEAFVMGAKAGVDPEIIYDAIKNGYAGSTVLDGKLGMVMDRNFKAGFRLDLHIKDLTNVLETGRALGTPMPLASVVIDEMQYLSDNGCGSEDNAVLMRYYERVADVELVRNSAK